jgi:hypothetical protein
VTRLKQCVRLAHAIPLLGDQLSIDGLVRAADQQRDWTLVAVAIDPADPSVLSAADAWAEA